MSSRGSRRIRSEKDTGGENSASESDTQLGATGENNMADIPTNTGQADQNKVLEILLNAAVEKLNLSLTTKMENMGQMQCAKISELERNLRSIFQEELHVMRLEIDKEVDDMRKQIQDLRNAPPSNVKHPEVSQNIVIRNIPHTEDENLEETVNTLLSEELNVDAQIDKVVRKVSHNDRPGVVIATMKSVDDRENVMRNKSKLKDSELHSGVMIHKDKPFHERRMEANMATLINVVAKDKLVLRGGRVQSKIQGNGQVGRGNVQQRNEHTVRNRGQNRAAGHQQRNQQQRNPQMATS